MLLTERLKIAIVDDHEMFRSGLKLILSEKPGWEIVIEALDGIGFLDRLKIITPDVVLMDISMPELDGYQTAKKALNINPGLKIIAVSMHSEELYYYKMIEAGVKGFILKNSGVEELFNAISEVVKGNNYFAQDLLHKIVCKLNNKEIDNKLKLSDKEKDVLVLICNGFTNKEIAKIMFLSIKSIEKYRMGLLQKTNTKNSAHLVMYAIQNKIIEI